MRRGGRSDAGQLARRDENRDMLERVDYSVIVPVPPVLAFRAFCDLDRLLHRDIYAEAAWIEGAPWRMGSRLRYVVQKPVAAVVSALVSSSDPPYSVTLLNHGLGITAEQQVTFAQSGDSTKARILVEARGTSREISEGDVQHAIEFLAHDALDTMTPLCDEFAGRMAES